MSKADEQATPTEAEVTAKNDAIKAEWEPDFTEEDLKIPYKREEDDGADTKESGQDDKPEKEAGSESNDDDTDAVQYTEPTPVVTLEDPGEFKPQDYSFEIEIDGKTHKVDTSEKAEELAEEYADKLNAKQLFALVNKGTKIERKTEIDREKWEKDKKAYDEQITTQKEREEFVEGMQSELNYLVDKGLIPAIDKQYVDADWSDPEVAKQPGVKEQIELITYMDKENGRRLKNKVKPLTSMVDAYNAWTIDTTRKQESEDKKNAGEQRRQNSSRVAGVSPTQAGSYVPKGISVGRVMPRNRAADWDN